MKRGKTKILSLVLAFLMVCTSIMPGMSVSDMVVPAKANTEKTILTENPDYGYYANSDALDAVPVTGDSTPVTAIWITLLCSAMVLAAMLFYQKRKKDNRTD